MSSFVTKLCIPHANARTPRNPAVSSPFTHSLSRSLSLSQYLHLYVPPGRMQYVNMTEIQFNCAMQIIERARENRLINSLFHCPLRSVTRAVAFISPVTRIISGWRVLWRVKETSGYGEKKWALLYFAWDSINCPFRLTQPSIFYSFPYSPTFSLCRCSRDISSTLSTFLRAHSRTLL